jgi:hypothetical protein
MHGIGDENFYFVLKKMNPVVDTVITNVVLKHSIWSLINGSHLNTIVLNGFEKLQ